MQTISKIENKLKYEMKIQKIADAGGKNGWKAAKEYEKPELGNSLE